MTQPGSHVWSATPIITKRRSKITYNYQRKMPWHLDRDQLLALYVQQPGSQDLDRPLCMSIAADGYPCRRVVRPGRQVCYACRATPR